MKLKNTLGLHISCMIGTVVAFPVIELRSDTNTSLWLRAMKVIVGGWKVHSFINDGIESSSAMLVMKHQGSGGWFSNHIYPGDHDGDSNWKGKNLSLTTLCKPRPHQLPVITNIGSIGHFSGGLRSGGITDLGRLDRSVFIAAETPPSKSEFLNGQGYMKRLAELTAKFEFDLPKHRQAGPKKFYFDPSAGLNPHLE